MEQEVTVTSACSIVTSVVNTTSFSTTTTTFPLAHNQSSLNQVQDSLDSFMEFNSQSSLL